MKKGVITVYLAITFSVMLSLIISALEAAKYSAYRVVSECALQSAIVSAFGEYHKEMLKQYDLFYIDQTYLTNRYSADTLGTHVEDYMNENLGEPETEMLLAKDFFGSGTATVSVSEKRMATDLFGSSLKRQAVEYIKDRTSADFVSDLISLIRVKKEYSLDRESFLAKKGDLENQANDALRAREEREAQKREERRLEKEKKKQQKQKNGQKNLNEPEDWPDEPEEDEPEPEDVKIIRNFASTDFEVKFIRPIMVVLLKEDAFDVSGKQFSPLDIPSTRLKSLASFQTTFQAAEADPFTESYFTQYILEKTGNYVRPKENSYLKYEAEYIISGRNNDSENLENAIEAIFYIRTAANYISIEQDQEKCELVDAVANGLSAITEVPAGVIGCLIKCTWAGAEATFDVEELCKGEKLALIKDADDFHVSLQGGIKHLLEDGAGNGSSGTSLTTMQETELGEYSKEGSAFPVSVKLSYEDYLRILIQETNPVLKNCRMMDVIELDIRQTEKNDTFRLDYCLDGAVFDACVISSFGATYELKRRYSY